VVAGRRTAPTPPRRSRSSDALAAVSSAATPPPIARSRRRESAPGTKPSDPPPAGVALHMRRDIPSMVDDEQEDAPTVALKVDHKMRDAVRDLAARARESTRPPLETVRMEDGETSQDPTRRKQAPVIPSPAATQRLGPQTSEELAGMDMPLGMRPRKPAIAEHVENELATLRELAMARHEQVKRAREAAHRAAIEADQAEAQARVAERAIAGARAALDLALRGDGPGAQRKLEDAMALVRQKPS
jgi:hypothetical protein